jgi:hypothetical protein
MVCTTLRWRGLGSKFQFRDASPAQPRGAPSGLNQTYLELATHYRTATLPTRPRKPRDKAKVASAESRRG